MKSFNNIFKLITLGNLFLCWDKFKKGGKLKKKDVQLFELNLEDNIVQLYEDIQSKRYKHLPYEKFYIYEKIATVSIYSVWHVIIYSNCYYFFVDIALCRKRHIYEKIVTVSILSAAYFFVDVVCFCTKRVSGRVTPRVLKYRYMH